MNDYDSRGPLPIFLMKPILSLHLFIFLITGCQLGSQTTTYPADFPATDDEFLLLLVSDEEYLEQEEHYYDAMIDLKKKYPDEMRNIKIVSASSNFRLVKDFDIEQYPSLLILKEKKLQTRIEGPQTKRAIKAHIQGTFKKD